MSIDPNADWPEQVLDWAFTMFGPIAYNRRERALRLLEEATELAQVEGVELETAVSVATRVYGRPAGDVVREIGQVHMTLAALAYNLGEDMDAEGRKEFDRVRSIPKEEWKRRHDAKVAIGIASNS